MHTIMYTHLTNTWCFSLIGSGLVGKSAEFAVLLPDALWILVKVTETGFSMSSLMKTIIMHNFKDAPLVSLRNANIKHFDKVAVYELCPAGRHNFLGKSKTRIHTVSQSVVNGRSSARGSGGTRDARPVKHVSLVVLGPLAKPSLKTAVIGWWNWNKCIHILELKQHILELKQMHTYCESFSSNDPVLTCSLPPFYHSPFIKRERKSRKPLNPNIPN